jgi:hypothetical protein
MIRAFSLGGSISMHVDSNDTTPKDLNYNMGLTLAPNLEMPMSLDGTEIKEKYVLFNDALPHGFPYATTPQISIRIFGDIEYDKLKIIWKVVLPAVKQNGLALNYTNDIWPISTATPYLRTPGYVKSEDV